MRNWFFSLQYIFAGTSVLFFCLFLLLLGLGLQGSLVGIRGSNEGFSTISLSLISTGFYAGYFVGSMVIPSWLKRVGYIRVFAAMVAMASVAALIYPMYIEQVIWFAMRMLTGFCFAGIYMVCESWLNSQTHNENRGKVLGFYLLTIFLGLTTGQFVLTLGEINSYFLFALGSVVISIASVPLLLAKRPAPVIEESTVNLSVLELCKRSPLGVTTSFFANYMNGSICGLSVIYAKNIGMPTDQIAWFVASAYIGVIILQLPIGYLSDYFDRRKAIFGLCFATVVTAVIAMSTTDKSTLVFLFGLLGGVSFPLYAVCIAYVQDRLNPEEVLPATSALLKIAGMGNMIAPILTGWIMVQWGAMWFFGVIGVAGLIVGIFALYRMFQVEIDVEEQGEFTPIGAMPTTAATMSLAHEGIQLEFDFGDPNTDETKQTEEL